MSVKIPYRKSASNSGWRNKIDRKKRGSIEMLPLCAPDEIRTHIDGTGNHNSIH